MNRTELKTRILTGINDSGPTLFTTAQLNDLIDEAAELIAGEVKPLRRNAIIPVQNGKIFYTLHSVADDIMVPFRIWNETQQERLYVTSLNEIDQFQQRAFTTQNTPEMWFPISWDMFGIWPWPSAGGGVLRVDYIAWPDGLDDDGDEMEMSITFQNAVVKLCTYFGLLKGWDVEKAAKVFEEFAKDEMFAKAKSGISRISHRSLTRSNLDLDSSIKE